MKICVIAPYLNPERGSFEYYLCRELSNLGFNVTIITSNVDPFNNTRYNEAKLKIDKFKVYRKKALFNFHIIPFLMLKEQDIKKINPDIVCSVEYFQPIALSAFRICKKLDIPYTFYQHMDKYPEGLLSPAFKFFNKLIKNYAWKDVYSSIALSNAAKRFLKGLGFNKPVQVIIGGVDTNKFKPKNKGYLKSKLNIKCDTFLVLSVSRLIPQKGVDKILKFAQKTHDMNIHYVIIGDGLLKDEIIEKSKNLNNITLIDFIPHDKLPEAYSDADLYIAPSNFEPLNFSVLEAMACGTAILASQVGGMKDTVNDDVGKLLPKDDIDLWTKTIKEYYYKQNFNTYDKKCVSRSKIFGWEKLAAETGKQLDMIRRSHSEDLNDNRRIKR